MNELNILKMTPLDQAWVIFAGCLVFLMQAGFLCVESGFSRAKHSMNVAVKNVADYVIASIGFYFVGYGLMFGKSFHGLLGATDFFFDAAYPGQPLSFFSSSFLQGAPTFL